MTPRQPRPRKQDPRLRAEPILPAARQGLMIALAQQAAATALTVAGIEDARLEAEVLLRYVLKLDRAVFFTRLQSPLAEPEAAEYEELLRRRRRHEPTAYITGRREFFGLDFQVTPAALIPRPETELLVETALARTADRRSPLLVDVGAGCGAIAVAVAVNQPRVRVLATDISAAALALTLANARRHGVGARIDAVRTDLLAGLSARFDLILANLPYVASAAWDTLAPEIRDHEPRLALDGGNDGLIFIRRLLLQAAPQVAAGASLCAEIGDDQGSRAIEIAEAAMPSARVNLLRDLAGRDRVLVVDPAGA